LGAYNSLLTDTSPEGKLELGIMYDMLQDEKSLNALANNLVSYFMKRGDFPGSLQKMLKPIVGYI
jgi:hypothetical protein